MILGMYQHYKGDIYRAIMLGWNSNNDQPREEMVVYVSLKLGTINVRSVKEFLEVVTDEDGINRGRQRFTYIGQPNPHAK